MKRTYYVGLDVSKDTTAICVRRADAAVERVCETATEPEAICVDARQAHAVLTQMHNKTDANDAAMLADLARTGFYRRVEVKSRDGQERRALLAARDAAIGARRNAENTIRSLLASFGLRVPGQPRTYEVLDVTEN